MTDMVVMSDTTDMTDKIDMPDMTCMTDMPDMAMPYMLDVLICLMY